MKIKLIILHFNVKLEKVLQYLSNDVGYIDEKTFISPITPTLIWMAKQSKPLKKIKMHGSNEINDKYLGIFWSHTIL